MCETDIEPLDELDKDQCNAQVDALLNATTFGAMLLVIGKQAIGMAFHTEVSLMEGIEVPCQTLEQQRRAVIVVSPAATWVLVAGKSIMSSARSIIIAGMALQAQHQIMTSGCGAMAGATVLGDGGCGRPDLVKLPRIKV